MYVYQDAMHNEENRHTLQIKQKQTKSEFDFYQKFHLIKQPVIPQLTVEDLCICMYNLMNRKLILINLHF